MDIAWEICTDSFYIVNSGTPHIPVTAVDTISLECKKTRWENMYFEKREKLAIFFVGLRICTTLSEDNQSLLVAQGWQLELSTD